jgi:hypothetical protein
MLLDKRQLMDPELLDQVQNREMEDTSPGNTARADNPHLVVSGVEQSAKERSTSISTDKGNVRSNQICVELYLIFY